MRCVRCGKREAKIKGLCEECFREIYLKLDYPSKFEIKRCPHCSAVKIHGEWIYDERKLIESLSRKIKISYPVDKLDVNGSIVLDSEHIFFVADVEYSLEGIVYRETVRIPIKVEGEACTICSRYYGNYFEAIVQIRGARNREEEERVRERFYEITSQIKDPALFVNREEDVRGGIDIYVSSKHHAKQIVNKLAEEFGAAVKESPQIAGRRDGQDLYRVTYSLRLPPYRKGDVVKISGRYYVVRDITSKGFSAMDIDNGKVTIFKHRIYEEKNGKVICLSKEIRKIQVVYDDGNTLQILNPTTYEVVEISKPVWYPEYDIGAFVEGSDLVVVPILK